MCGGSRIEGPESRVHVPGMFGGKVSGGHGSAFRGRVRGKGCGVWVEGFGEIAHWLLPSLGFTDPGFECRV